MLYRVLVGIGLLALGYYVGRHVGRVEGQMSMDVEPLGGDSMTEERFPDPDDS